jgi:D-glycero-D-manno-heptose 1,7-bisphosphate phosphatase
VIPRPRRAVFLDRDGVLNRSVVWGGKPYPPSCLAELEILEGVPEALDLLKKAGFLLICVTNQPDVSRGTQSRETVEVMHKRLLEVLPLDEICVCYEDGDDCPRRKPNPGMIFDAAQRLNIDLAKSFMVGDRWRDIDAGHRAGCTTIFIDYGYAETLKAPPHYTVGSLVESVHWIFEQTESGESNGKH